MKFFREIDGLGEVREEKHRPLHSRWCEERCCSLGFDAWLASDDKWFCEECLEDYWARELDALGVGPDDEILAATDNEDEFTHFVVMGTKRREVWRCELEAKRKEFENALSGVGSSPLLGL